MKFVVSVLIREYALRGMTLTFLDAPTILLDK